MVLASATTLSGSVVRTTTETTLPMNVKVRASLQPAFHCLWLLYAHGRMPLAAACALIVDELGERRLLGLTWLLPSVLQEKFGACWVEDR